MYGFTNMLSTAESSRDQATLFAGIKFCMMQPVKPWTREALVTRGAIDHGNYLNRNITHLICDNYEFQQHISAEYLKPPDMTFMLATSEWVRWSVLCGMQLPTRPFSYARISIFDNMVFGIGGDSSSLNSDDKAKLWAMVNYYGGRWSSRSNLCTHLIVADCPNPQPSKTSKLCQTYFVTPNYVVECILALTRLDERLFNPADYHTSPPKPERLLTRTGNLKWWSTLRQRRSQGLERPGQMFRGCSFHFIDYEYLVPMEKIEKWKQMVQSHGGVVVQNIQEQRLTHLVCENRCSDLYKRALACGRVKIITAYWIEDTILQKEQKPPWLPYHFPLAHSQLRRKELPLRRHVVHSRGFDDDTDRVIQTMVTLLGGIYSNTLTLMCSIVVQGRNCQSIAADVLCVNQRWLVELFLGSHLMNKQLSSMFTNPDDPCTVFHFDRCFVVEFLAAWMVIDPRLNLLNPESMKEESPPRYTQSRVPQLAEPLPPEIRAPRPWRRNYVTPMSEIVVAFTGFSKRQLRELTAMASRLPDGRLANDDFEVTHLVAKQFVRTSRFLTCISVCSFVLNHKWVLDSQAQGHFIHPPLEDHVLNDEAAIVTKGLSLSLALRRKRPLFQGLSFFCMPGVQPSAGDLKNPILAAGGTCLTELASVISNPSAIVIARPEDVEVLMPLIKRGANIQNVRFILDNLFREEIDFDSYSIVEATTS